jgi:hypothetical protein
VKLSELAGLWRRSLLIRSDGTRDVTTQVWWLQGPAIYVDLRQPAHPPGFPQTRGLGDLCMEQCAWLAKQQGFAGELTHDGSCFEWRRTLDFQPPTAEPDAGTLHWEDKVLVETGRDSPYVEHWHRDGNLPRIPTFSVALQAHDCDQRAILLRVGDLFMFARDREIALPTGRTLAECVAAADSLRAMQALLDCEISFGDVRTDCFHITASTLPYRVGDFLQPRHAGPSVTTMDRAQHGERLQRHWRITDTRGSPG